MIKRHANAIGNAVNGIKWALGTQDNYKTHLTLILLSILGGILFEITSREWQTIAVTALLGLIIETINTAIEKLGDAIDRKYNEDIKIAKDVSAGAMLLFAIGAVVIACIIFIPKMMAWLL